MFKELINNLKQHLNFFFENINLSELEIIFDICRKNKGFLAFSGVGKSGIIAKKISQTLTSTGTKAFFLPVLDALHGDIGSLGNDDILFCLSKSGNTQELLDLIMFAKQKKIKIISVTSSKISKIGKLSDLNVYLPLEKELCPYNLAPTTSTTLQIIFGDILAIALMRAKKFSINDFALNHPKGSIGSKILQCVDDLMLKGSQLPLAMKDDTLLSKLEELTTKKCGCLLILDNEDKLIGIFTDGDLRRALEKYSDKVLSCKLDELMTANFSYITPETLLWDAIDKMEEKEVTVLPVLDNFKLVGLVKMHDILQSSM